MSARNDTLYEAEDALLSLCISNPEALANMDLVPADMHTDYGQIVFAALLRLYDARKPVSGISLAHELRSSGELDRIGGLDQIKIIRRDTHHIAELPRIVEIIRDASMLSKMNSISRTVASLAANEALPMAERYQKACELVKRLEGVRDTFEPMHIKDGILNGIRDIEERTEMADKGIIPGLPTGLKDLDETIMGLRPGNLITIAGRTSMGKTVLAMQIVAAACKKGSRALVFSMEMSSGELSQRQAASMGEVSLSAITGGRMTGPEFSAYSAASGTMAQWNLWIDERGGIDMREVANVARKKSARSGLDLIVIDHLLLMSHGGNNLAQGIGETMGKLKALAKELKVPIIIVAQLNREAAKGITIRRPVMTDLQESGRIEQDSDVIMLLHRPGYYDPKSPQNEAEIIIAKNRQGQRNVTIRVEWEGQYTRFKDWAKPYNWNSSGKDRAAEEKEDEAFQY